MRGGLRFVIVALPGLFLYFCYDLFCISNVSVLLLLLLLGYMYYCEYKNRALFKVATRIGA